MSRRKGFSLIELLVVIGIVAILAAILFPMLVKARDRANQTRCYSNMRQLALAVLNYAQDCNNMLPQPFNTVPGEGIRVWQTAKANWPMGTWREEVMPYVKSEKVLNCSVPNFKKQDQAFVSDHKLTNKFCHYGMNWGLTSATQGAVNVAYGLGCMSTSKIQIASQTFLIGENLDGDWSLEPIDAVNGATDLADGCIFPYHLQSGVDPSSKRPVGGGGNFAFCDGHVKFLNVKQTQVNDFYLWKANKGVKYTNN